MKLWKKHIRRFSLISILVISVVISSCKILGKNNNFHEIEEKKLLREARVCFFAEEYEKALDLCDKNLYKNPCSEEFIRLKSEIYSKLKNDTTAVNILEDYLKNYPREKQSFFRVMISLTPLTTNIGLLLQTTVRFILHATSV